MPLYETAEDRNRELELAKLLEVRFYIELPQTANLSGHDFVTYSK